MLRRAIYVAAIVAVLLIFPHHSITADGTGGSAAPLYEDKAGSLLDAIDARTRELDEREAVLRLEEEKLKALGAEVDGKIEELKAATITYDKVLSALIAAEDEELQKLAKVYESMPPEEAATRMERLEMKLAVKLLKTIKSRQAGKILSFVEPTLAAQLSEEFGRGIIPKKELSPISPSSPTSMAAEKGRRDG